MCFVVCDDVDKLIKQAEQSGNVDEYIKKVMIDHIAYFYRDPETKKPREKEAKNLKAFTWGVWWGKTKHVYGGPNTNVSLYHK